MPHIHELIDFTVTAFVVHDDKVLLVNHPRYGMWIPMGGHIELDEDPDQALFREIKEETGMQDIKILSERPDYGTTMNEKPLLTPNYMSIHDANPPHRHISLIYFAQAMSSVLHKSDEHTELRWFAREELEDEKYSLTPDIKFYCTKALEKAASS